MKKPFAGLAAGIIFGALGLLLIRIDTTPGAPRGMVLWMFKIAGYFVIFTALGSLVTAVHALWIRKKNKTLF